ncbi:hypothetical protein F4808DRAFT_323411 [Astrocystis sublimbata]|nr:hypothetical protein F4808DRAFT_323411 [Astrocystis sublimbata]
MSVSFSADDQNAVTASRLNAGIGGYQQVIAITQDAVNASLASRWAKSPIHFKTRYVEITGDMLAPTVEFLNTPSRHEALFRINLGSFNYRLKWIDEDDIVQHDDISFADWSLCYSVSFSEEKLEASSVPEEVKKVWGNTDTYTAFQVMLDFSMTNFLSPNAEQSRMPGIDAADFEDQKRQDLKQGMFKFLSDWVVTCQREKKNILSWYAVDKLQRFPKPSVPAKKTTFQTYPFYTNGNAGSGQLVPGYTCFVFASMLTDGSDFPRNEGGIIRPLEFSGDLVLPFARGAAADLAKQAACTRIVGDIFWKQIEPDLLSLAASFVFTPDYVKVHADTNLSNVYYMFRPGMGRHATMSALTKMGAGIPFPFITPGSQVYMTSYGNSKRAHDEAGSTNASEIWAQIDTDGSCIFAWQPGSNIIQVVGSSHVVVTYQQKVALNWWGTAKIRMGWAYSYSLALGTNQNGELAFSIVDDSWRHFKDPKEDEVDLPFGYVRPPMDDFGRMMNDITIADPVKALSSLVASHKPYILPAAGQWWMQSPVFANNGDVLIGMTIMEGRKP